MHHIQDFVILHNLDINLSQRNNVLELQSLVFDQFSSPRYKNLFQYSWFKSGYISDRPGSFDNPVKFGFKGDQIVCDICTEIRMIICSLVQDNAVRTSFKKKYAHVQKLCTVEKFFNIVNVKIN